MRLSPVPVLLLLLSATSTALAATISQQPLKAIIVSYPAGTPKSVLDQAMDAIKQAGGVVTHEYTLISGFAAKAPAKILESVSAWGKDHGVNIEEDEVVSIQS